MFEQRHGFSVVELVIALAVGGVLTGMAMKSFSGVGNQVAATQARNAYVGMAARARAQAIESGTSTVLLADAAGDSLVLLAISGQREIVHLGEGGLGVDLRAGSPVTRLCMNPRGYADTRCNSFSSPVELVFAQGMEADTVEILPLGQLRYD